MDNRQILNDIFTSQTLGANTSVAAIANNYGRMMAQVENVVAVVSDLAAGTSRIYCGGFAAAIGLKDYESENSIWESKILDMMSPDEQQHKFIAELRFFHHLRRLPKTKRRNCYLVSRLRFNCPTGSQLDVLHRMYYLFDSEGENIVAAICLYGPLTFEFTGKSYAVNSATGTKEELTTACNAGVLSKRERQVLSLIATGLKSADIGERLHISTHTVSRHRQEILSKLQVKNSPEAIRLAKSMELI